ncbi:MAG: hypothetical protein AB3N20_21505 [Rhizobiaceae bacterium]
MARTPRTKHSKKSREPVTIELEAEDVKSAEDQSAEGNSDGVKPDSDADADGGAQSGKTDESSDAADQGSGDPEGEGGGVTEGRDHDASPPKKNSFAGLIGAGIVGGLIVLGGSLLLPGLLGGQNASPDSEIEAKLTALRSELKADLSKLEQAGNEATSAAIAAAKAELDTEISNGAADIAALKESLAQVQSALEAGDGGEGAALQALGDRLNALEQTVSGLSNGSADVDSDAVSALTDRISTIDQSIAALQEQVSGLQSSSGEAATSIETLKAEIGELSKRLEQQGGNPEVARAIAAAALKSAIDRGLPFMTELETYASVAPESPAIEALRELAARGVPTRSEIASEMTETANAMVAAANSSGEDASIWEQLLSSAQSLIKVRPIGLVEGDTPAAIVARMEVAVNANNYQAALAEFETLPDGVKAAGQALADKIMARSQVDALIDTALAAALAPAQE